LLMVYLLIPADYHVRQGITTARYSTDGPKRLRATGSEQ